eukprot:1195441-Prorocentrum_minimum.AAC.1
MTSEPLLLKCSWFYILPGLVTFSGFGAPGMRVAWVRPCPPPLRHTGTRCCLPARPGQATHEPRRRASVKLHMSLAGVQLGYT